MQGFIASYGYLALFAIAVVEGPVATVVAGLLAAHGLLDAWVVLAVVVAADLVGDMLYYGAGHWLATGLAGGGGWRDRPWARRLRARVDDSRPKVHAAAGPLLIFGKITHSAGFVVLMAAGAARVSLPRFLGFNFAATLPKSAVLLAVGYWFGQLYQAWRGDLSLLAFGMFALAAAGLAVLFHRFGRHRPMPPG